MKQKMCPQDGRIDDLGWNVDAHLSTEGVAVVDSSGLGEKDVQAYYVIMLNEIVETEQI